MNWIEEVRWECFLGRRRLSLGEMEGENGVNGVMGERSEEESVHTPMVSDFISCGPFEDDWESFFSESLRMRNKQLTSVTWFCLDGFRIRLFALETNVYFVNRTKSSHDSGQASSTSSSLHCA